jgi:DNA-binding beta-propeller fold protein YncE
MKMARRGWLPLAVVGMALAACDSTTAPHDHDDEIPIEAARRLLVADYEASNVRLVAVEDGATMDTWTLTEPAYGMVPAAGHRFAFVAQRNTHRVDVIDGGIWTEDHADHAHLHTVTPVRLGTPLEGQRPTHLHVNDGHAAIFFDGDGSVKFVRELELIGRNYAVTTIQTGGAVHGAAMAMGGAFLASPPNPAGGSPNTVNIYNRDGQLLSSHPDCPGLHGNAANTNTAIFGCTDGALVVRRAGNDYTVEKLPMLQDMGLRDAMGRTGQPFFVGRYSRSSDTRMLGRIDAATGAQQAITLPGTWPLTWGVDPTNQHILVFDETGNLYVVDANSLAVVRTIANVTAPIINRARTAHLAVAEGVVYVSSPGTGEVVEIDYTTGTTTRRFAVGGMPGRLVLLGAQRNVEIDNH